MYAELKAKTNFSFLEGASQPDELIERAHEIGLTAIGITDRNGVYGVPKAYWKAREYPKLKLLVGCELTVENHPSLTLLSRDRGAYAVMCRLITAAHADKEKGKAFLRLSELVTHLEDPRARGLLCFPDRGLASETVSQATSRATAQMMAQTTSRATAHSTAQMTAQPGAEVGAVNYPLLKELFEDRLFVSLSRFQDGHDHKRFASARELSKRYDISIVATNEVLSHVRERRPLQDALSCVREGVSLVDAGFKLHPNGERYLKSPEEMSLLFRDFPSAIKATVEIAESCTFSLKELRYRYPSEWIPSQHSAQSFLEELTMKGAITRYSGNIPEAVTLQIRHELRLIEQLGFADYFLTIYDIVDFANRREDRKSVV